MPGMSASDVAAVWRTSVGAGRLIVTVPWTHGAFATDLDSTDSGGTGRGGESSPPGVAVIEVRPRIPASRLNCARRHATLLLRADRRPPGANHGDGKSRRRATTEPMTFRLWPGDGVGGARRGARPDKPGVIA